MVDGHIKVELNYTTESSGFLAINKFIVIMICIHTYDDHKDVSDQT